MGIRHLTGKGMACCVNALLRCDGLVYVRGLDYRAVLSKGLVGRCGKDFLMKRIVLLIILLFSFSMFSLADNARLDAQRDAEKDVNDTVWALAGFSAPLLMGGYYIAGGTAGGTISYTVFVPGVIVSAVSQYYPISPRSDRFLGKAPEYVSAYVAAYEAKVKSLRRRSLLWGFGAGIGLLIVLNSMDVL